MAQWDGVASVFEALDTLTTVQNGPGLAAPAIAQQADSQPPDEYVPSSTHSLEELGATNDLEATVRADAVVCYLIGTWI